MTITYKLEPDDLRAFQRYGQKHLPSARRARYIIGVAMVAFSSLLTLTSEDHRIGFRITYFCVLLFVFWLLMRVYMFVVTRIMQWRSFTSDKHRSVICEHTVTLADDALVEATPFNESRNLWSGIYRVVDAADYIYIFLSLHAAHIIPKRAFADRESARRFYERAASLQSGAQKVAAIAVMPEPGSIAERFKKLREGAGLSLEEAAAMMNVSPFHIEIPDDEFTCEYSPADVRRFCQILKASPSELFAVSTTKPPVSASALVQLIGAECSKRNVTLEQFEDAVGWSLSHCMNPPERLFEEMSLDGLQWLCHELGIHWHRVILSL